MKHWYDDPAPSTMVEPADESQQQPVQEVPPRRAAIELRRTARPTAGKPPDRFKP
ncbi:MAG: hypothetical protein GY832_14455 [Chloroflexi bacterium]|nr:hypothetical protein [Chloroflexota bacterium]